MHTLSDLLLEAVENSSEAGSGSIRIDAHRLGSIWHITVADDGRWTLKEGITTKGKGRGRGLAIIREQSVSCHLGTDGQGTKLSFEAEDDGSLDDFYQAFLPVFLRDAEVQLSVRGAFRLTSSELKESDAFPDNASGIRGFRALMESIKRRR